MILMLSTYRLTYVPYKVANFLILMFSTIVACYLHSLSLAGACWPLWCSSEVEVEGPY